MLLVLFLTIMTLVLLDTAISQASEGTVARLREEIGGYFKVETDYQKMDILQTVDQSMIDQVMKIDGIKAYNAMATYYLTVPELLLKARKFSMEADSKAQMARLLGNTDRALNEYFMLDLFQLEEGRHIAPSDAGKALVSGELANDSVVKTEQRLEEETSFSFDRPIDMDAVDVDVQLNMELNPPAVLAAGGMGLLIVALSAGLSFLVIVRCRPKELLTVME